MSRHKRKQPQKETWLTRLDDYTLYLHSIATGRALVLSAVQHAAGAYATSKNEYAQKIKTSLHLLDLATRAGEIRAYQLYHATKLAQNIKRDSADDG